ncbi:hypothetical protein FJ444_19180 [Aestuariibacter sp. GS-14]|uniref:SDR family oxidoreductase n=1 Tax=Aestuariibacter sp. GS-14 TaxID=2590670 RepID=UPI00112D2894|nr:NAD(P)H-binding protein [Aestuariibacter sp. GS-14]TPV54309.1 hypothetical protein FJ444_19180 [Aestuariibacter sp. GS-14]
MTSTTINKICILGASGLIAQETIKAFALEGFSLRLFSRNIAASNYPMHETLRGDVFNDSDLAAAIDGCDAIHITLSQLDEYSAVQRIVRTAKDNGNIKLISFVSGATVCYENSKLLPFIAAKYRSEQHLKQSDIPYLILRPTWFMESLSIMVQNGKANVMGKQPNKLRWLAAKDFGSLLAHAYKKPETYNQEFNIYGPEALTINEALSEYVKVKHPQIPKINNAPFGMLKVIAFLTQNQKLKAFIPIFEYFEKAREVGDSFTSDILIGKPVTTLKMWLN